MLPLSLDNNMNKLNDDSAESIELKLIHDGSNTAILLSQQQSKCLNLLARGKSTKAIALELHISPRTVESHLLNIRNKLGCGSSKELIARYYEEIILKQ